MCGGRWRAAPDEGKGITRRMKKVTKYLSLLLAVILTASAFQMTDASVSSVKAAGENGLDPIIIPYNTGDYASYTTQYRDTYYAIDLPEDGDLKITILSDYAYLEKFYTDSYNFIDAYENISTNKPYVAHFTATAGRYYLYFYGAGKNFKIKTEFSGFGFKDEFDDVYENPKMYSLGTEANGAVGYTDEYDWYKFEIPENDKYKISYIANTGYYDFNILDNDLNSYWYDISVKGNELKTANCYFLKGTYYIKIVGGRKAKYKFTIARTGVTPTAIKKVKAGKKSAKVTFKKVDDVTGYQIRYSTNKNFKGKVKTKSFAQGYSSTNNLYATIKKLKKNKTYYFQIRTFEEGRSGNYYYSDWSNTKRVKVR